MTLLVSLIHAWQAANSGSIKRKSKDWMGTKHWAINPCLLQLPTHLLTAASTELPPGGKSLKSLKRLFNWRIFILSLTRRLWEWSAPVAPFISPWSPIEPTNIGQPPNCNEISLWGHFLPIFHLLSQQTLANHQIATKYLCEAIFTGNVILYYTACLSKEDGVQFYLKIPPIFLVLFVQFLSCESIFPQSTTSR